MVLKSYRSYLFILASGKIVTIIDFQVTFIYIIALNSISRKTVFTSTFKWSYSIRTVRIRITIIIIVIQTFIEFLTSDTVSGISGYTGAFEIAFFIVTSSKSLVTVISFDVAFVDVITLNSISSETTVTCTFVTSLLIIRKICEKSSTHELSLETVCVDLKLKSTIFCW